MPKNNRKANRRRPTSGKPETRQLGMCIYQRTLFLVIRDMLNTLHGYAAQGIEDPNVTGNCLSTLDLIHSRMTDTPYGSQDFNATVDWAKRMVGLENLDIPSYLENSNVIQ